MLYSYNVEDEKAQIFSMFIEKIINGDNSYKEEVMRVLNEVKELSLDRKTLYSIDRNYFSVIMRLFESNSEFFKLVDLDNINNSDYRVIEASLNKSENFICA
jgi:hypothetical protein